MRKIIRIISPLILIIVLVSFSFSSSTPSVKQGDYTEYLISTAEFSATVGSNSLSCSGIKMSGNNVPVGSILSINITNILGDRVYFYFSSQGNELLGIANPDIEQISMWSSVLYIIGTLDSLTNDWDTNIGYYENGFDLYYVPTFIPFFEGEQETWDFIDNFNNQLQSYFTENSTDHLSYSSFYLNSEKGDTYIGEWLVLFEDNRHNSLFTANLTATSHFKLAMDRSTGILLGSRYEGSCSGVLNDFPINIEFKLLFQEVNYDMPEFEYDSTGGLSASNWMITTSSIAFVTMIVTLIIKIKSRKKKI